MLIGEIAGDDDLTDLEDVRIIHREVIEGVQQGLGSGGGVVLGIGRGPGGAGNDGEQNQKSRVAVQHVGSPNENHYYLQFILGRAGWQYPLIIFVNFSSDDDMK